MKLFFFLALCSAELTITSNAGTFTGFNSSDTVRNWLGIRYGKPTSGYQRFRPAARAAIGTFNATEYSPSCPQNRGSSYTGFNAISYLGNATDGEDCLSLNIWSPQNATGLPVMIWVYGGAFAFGTSNTPFYDGNNFARDQNVIIVTINYRTTIFGFPAGAPALSIYERNLGLTDQRMAIEWVYSNIRAFGGDPERITLFGESAGAASIGAYAYAYEYDPIVKGLILESGSEVTIAQTSVTNATKSALGWEYVASTAGCALNATGSAMRQLECLQKLDFHKIQNITSAYSGAGIFVPTRDNVSVFSGTEYGNRLRSGSFANIPLLVGNNDNEGSILIALYPGSTPNNVTTYGFTCPSALLAQSRRAANVSAWQYRYLGLFPSLSPIPALGVYHSSEIPVVFGTYNLSTLGNASNALIQTSRNMQSGWAAFARDPENGLIDYGWPEYASNGSTLIVINNSTTFQNSTEYNGLCNIPITLSRGN